MITSVLFDMGGTLEDIYVDAQSEWAAIDRLREMLVSYDLDPKVDREELKSRVDAGWVRYGKFRDSCDVELKPIPIWRDYVLEDFHFPAERLEPRCEEIAHMWEVTHFHRALRPRVAEMLEGLKGLGLKLGIVSNTAALYQVFAVLKEYGIRDYFQDVTLSSVTGYRKPDPNIFLVSLNQVRSDPKTCAYVGDTYSRDVIGPQNLGFGATFHIHSFLTQSRDGDVPKDVRATYTIQDIYEVYTILRDRAGGKAV